jgi:putative DNA methylase
VADAPNLHSRGYLPHYEWPGATQLVTFRLSDSLPAEWLRARQRSRFATSTGDRIQRILALEAELDACRGRCHLRDARAAVVVEANLRHFDGLRYHLLAWVVMPNHVHVLLRLAMGWSLARVVHTWKTRSATMINRLFGLRGRFWQPEYFDRRIRDDEHLARCVRYVENNPVVAGLCKNPADWPFGSARLRAQSKRP